MAFIMFQNNDGYKAVNTNYIRAMYVKEVGIFYAVQVELDEGLYFELGNYYTTDEIANWAMKRMLEDAQKTNVVKLPEEKEYERETHAKARAKAMKMSIDDIDLSVGAYNALKRGGMNTVGDVCEKTYGELLRVRNLGRKSYEEIVQKLAALHCSLKTYEDSEET